MAAHSDEAFLAAMVSVAAVARDLEQMAGVEGPPLPQRNPHATAGWVVAVLEGGRA